MDHLRRGAGRCLGKKKQSLLSKKTVGGWLGFTIIGMTLVKIPIYLHYEPNVYTTTIVTNIFNSTATITASGIIVTQENP